jgi:hypothetical protein
MNFQPSGGYPPIKFTKKPTQIQPIKKILDTRGFAAPPALTIADILKAKKREDLMDAGFRREGDEEAAI